MELFEQTKDLAVMEERNRLARDLHDSAKQKAFAALAQLGTANGIIRTKPEDVIPHLTEAETLVYEVIQELTFLIQEIYPIALQEKGLPTTLREYVFEWENRNDAVINLTVQNERALPLDVEQAVYRFIQEALANVSRHSRAKRVDISLVYNPESLQVIIADDGHGFDMNQKAKGMGFPFHAGTHQQYSRNRSDSKRARAGNPFDRAVTHQRISAGDYYETSSYKHIDRR